MKKLSAGTHTHTRTHTHTHTARQTYMHTLTGQRYTDTPQLVKTYIYPVTLHFEHIHIARQTNISTH